jgi:adenylosuccinate lyase
MNRIFSDPPLPHLPAEYCGLFRSFGLFAASDMEMSPLHAVSPVDGRYARQTRELQAFFSEFALMRYRVYVEIEYFIALSRLPLPQLTGIGDDAIARLRGIHRQFGDADARRIKEIEQTTNHDVKAVEYYLREKWDEAGLGRYREFIHFGLTSQDVNNTAVPLSLRDALTELAPVYQQVIGHIEALADTWKEVPMLARTHGQPASPTTLGKELKVFSERLRVQWQQIGAVPFSAKFGGATGNFNAHYAAYPAVDWHRFADDFVEHELKLKRSWPTTQIEHYDNLAALFDALKRFNTVLIDLCRDAWQYISMDYFRQKIKAGEVGSSAMPHKVNPIDFENAEGNLGMANALFEFMSAKLPVSRLQRDLTDSTVLRNAGMPFAHSLIALKSIRRGLEKLELNRKRIDDELNGHWIVLAEAFQTILRREGLADPYELLKGLTRTHTRIDRQALWQFIDGLPVSDSVRTELKALTPFNYTGNTSW